MTENKDIEEIFSKSIRSGRRTYFFDVRSTKAGDYYMTLTESKRDFNEDGSPFYKKHKIYLYKEDFANFKEAKTTAVKLSKRLHKNLSEENQNAQMVAAVCAAMGMDPEKQEEEILEFE